MLSPELVVRMPPDVQLTDDQFFEFCQLNRDLRIERSKTGELLIMPPTDSETGNREGNLFGQLWMWSEEDGTGICFSSSTGFTISGVPISPDASWMTLEKWNALPAEERVKFAAICPEFVAELRSPSDTLKGLQEKMQDYIEAGAKLGWLIDRKQRKVYIYRPATIAECLENPPTISGDPVLPGFVLNLSKIW